eukprot:9297037-Alexandrium_andersonii.AAC.1
MLLTGWSVAPLAREGPAIICTRLRSAIAGSDRYVLERSGVARALAAQAQHSRCGAGACEEQATYAPTHAVSHAGVAFPDNGAPEP